MPVDTVRLATISVEGAAHLAVATEGDELIDVTRALAEEGLATPPVSVSDLLGGARASVDDLRAVLPRLLATAPRLALVQAQLRPPHLPSANVFCVGVNYTAHVQEARDLVQGFQERPEPTWFSKDSRAFCGPYDDIVVDPGLTQMLDWEVELAVVIGRGGRRIPAARALDHVFGYTIVNDVSARDVQAARTQWFLGKNLPGSSPMGPFVVTADEVPDPQALELTCTVDGEMKQRAGTADMVHSVVDLIADLSRFVELRPGDVLSTGTPSGVGAASTPPQFLRSGSRLVTAISGLGRQENLVRAATAS